MESTLKNEKPNIMEINLLSYLIRRMDDNQIKEYNVRLIENGDDSRVRSIKDIINDAYETLASGTEQYYDGKNLEDLIADERKAMAPYQTMNKDIFWEMIDTARQQSRGEYNAMQQILTERLSRVTPENIIRFEAIKETYIGIANCKGIYELGCELNNRGLSDDAFMDFRGWLIGQGKNVYMQAMKDPCSVTELGLKPREGYFEWETFNYIADDAYEQSTGHSAYDISISQEQLDKMREDIESEIEIGVDNAITYESELSQLMNGGL